MAALDAAADAAAAARAVASALSAAPSSPLGGAVGGDGATGTDAAQQQQQQSHQHEQPHDEQGDAPSLDALRAGMERAAAGMARQTAGGLSPLDAARALRACDGAGWDGASHIVASLRGRALQGAADAALALPPRLPPPAPPREGSPSPRRAGWVTPVSVASDGTGVSDHDDGWAPSPRCPATCPATCAVPVSWGGAAAAGGAPGTPAVPSPGPDAAGAYHHD
eukprot:gene14584-6253_t